MISRYLFRDGVLAYKGTSLSNFLEVALKDDYMLAAIAPATDMPADESGCSWSAHKRVLNAPGLAWKIQPESVTQELRALLLLQQ
jgi:hypothetical protein